MLKQRITPVMILGQEADFIQIRLTEYELGGSTCKIAFQIGYTESFPSPLDEVRVEFTSVMSGVWQPSQAVFDSWGVDDTVLLTGFMLDRGLVEAAV